MFILGKLFDLSAVLRMKVPDIVSLSLPEIQTLSAN